MKFKKVKKTVKSCEVKLRGIMYQKHLFGSCSPKCTMWDIGIKEVTKYRKRHLIKQTKNKSKTKKIVTPLSQFTWHILFLIRLKKKKKESHFYPFTINGQRVFQTPNFKSLHFFFLNFMPNQTTSHKLERTDGVTQTSCSYICTDFIQ